MPTIQDALDGLTCGQELPCGCIVGSFLCPEAESLWARVMDAYRTKVRPACRNPQSPECERAWEECKTLEEQYNRHFYEQRSKLFQDEKTEVQDA